MNRLSTIFILPVVLAFISCSSPSKAYKDGDYHNAVELSIKKLRKNPNDAEAKDLLQRAYKDAVVIHEDKIRILSNSQNDSRFEKILTEYQYLQNLYETIRRYPPSANAVNPTDYSAFIESFKDQAANAYIAKGQRLMDERNKLSYQQAYNEFKNALRFKPEDLELRKKMDNAFDSATTKVVVVFESSSPSYNYTNSRQLKNFQDVLMNNLFQRMNYDFIKFYADWEVKSKNIRPDQKVVLDFSRFTIGEPLVEKNTTESSKEVVVKETVYKQDSVVKEKAKVYAKVTSVKRTVNAEGDLSIAIRDLKDNLIWNDRFTGNYKWKSEFATYSGDERALSDADKALLKSKEEELPSNDSLIEQLLRQIQNDLTPRLQNYYRQYQYR